MVERTHVWLNTFKKLVWCTGRIVRVVAFWIAFVNLVVMLHGLIRVGWTVYRRNGRPAHRP